MSKIEKEWLFWLDYILEAVDKIEKLTKQHNESEFVKKWEIHDVVLMNLINIGEFTTHIPDHIKSKYSHIQWMKIKSFRNLIVHDYHGISLAQVWNTTQTSIPELKKTNY